MNISRQIHVAIIDDDPFVVAHLRHVFKRAIPEVTVEGIADPVAPAGFDVYVVDREFHGDARGREVIRRLRALAPDALILAYSACLDREFLRELLLEGCAGAFDKGSTSEIDAMILTIRKYLANQDLQARVRPGLGTTVHAISTLLREWNLRLADSGRAEARRFPHA
jgi:DNA-binding NarL/FixJ family response regulator